MQSKALLHGACHIPCGGRRREKLAKKESELAGVKTDRSNAQMEKAALERQLKQVQSQTGRLAKDLEKKVRWWSYRP